MQQSGGAASYAGTTDALRTIWRTEGFRGVYKGYGATLLSFGPYSALYFLFYEQLRGLCVRYGGYKSKNDIAGSLNLASGAGAGSLAALLSNPLDLVKLRLQVQRGATATGNAAGELNFGYRGVLDGVGKIYRHEGPVVSFCFAAPCLLSEMIGSMCCSLAGLFTRGGREGDVHGAQQRHHHGPLRGNRKAPQVRG